jgi:hypothetical protein
MLLLIVLLVSVIEVTIVPIVFSEYAKIIEENSIVKMQKTLSLLLRGVKSP